MRRYDSATLMRHINAPQLVLVAWQLFALGKFYTPRSYSTLFVTHYLIKGYCILFLECEKREIGVFLSHTASKPFREAKTMTRINLRHWGYYMNVDKALLMLALFILCLAYEVLLTGSGDRTDLYISLSFVRRYGI